MEQVDLALVLAIDGSASVTYDEFNLICGGLGTALRDGTVIAGLIGGPAHASLAAVLLWSGHDAQEVMVDWTRIDSEGSAQDFAAAVENMPRIVRAGATAIGEALRASLAMFDALPLRSGFRRVVDVAGDGRSNEGTPPGPVRDRMVAAGFTINGLCVLHEEPDLLESYRREVIGGPGSFALHCANYSGFAAAMREKLAREIKQVPIA